MQSPDGTSLASPPFRLTQNMTIAEQLVGSVTQLLGNPNEPASPILLACVTAPFALATLSMIVWGIRAGLFERSPRIPRRLLEPKGKARQWPKSTDNTEPFTPSLAKNFLQPGLSSNTPTPYSSPNTPGSENSEGLEDYIKEMETDRELLEDYRRRMKKGKEYDEAQAELLKKKEQERKAFLNRAIELKMTQEEIQKGFDEIWDAYNARAHRLQKNL